VRREEFTVMAGLYALEASLEFVEPRALVRAGGGQR
jgi:hypothetical protein